MKNVRFRNIVLVAAALLAAGCVAGCGSKKAAQSVVSGPLSQARAAHATVLDTIGPAPAAYQVYTPAGVTAVTYQSGPRSLNAWLLEPASRADASSRSGEPSTAGKHPAVLYCHSGFSLGQADYLEARAFEDAGYVVLLPSWRGENGNSGSFEMLYGEVDDARAALSMLAKLPNVDATRLYAAGWATGGTLAFLLAECDDRLRGVGACGAFPDPQSYTDEHNEAPFKHTPFHWQDPVEGDLRSPARHLADLKCPVNLYYGVSERLYRSQASTVRKRARELGKSVTMEVIPGANHVTAPAYAIPRMIAAFNAE
jgi:dipeptidyl aminopeptidase/acylaminoacyl peptidase